MQQRNLQISLFTCLILLISHQVLSVAVSVDAGKGGRKLNGSGHKTRHRLAHEASTSTAQVLTAQVSSATSDTSAEIQFDSSKGGNKAALIQQNQPQKSYHVGSTWSSVQSESQEPGSSSTTSASSDTGFTDDYVSAWSSIPKDPFTWDGETSWEWDNPRTLYFEPLSGLGNRLRALASAVVLAKEYGVGLKVIWWEEPAADFNPGFNSTWKDLFAEPNLRLVDNYPGITTPISSLMNLYRADNRDDTMPVIQDHQCVVHVPHNFAEMKNIMQTGWKMLSTGEDVLCVRSDLWLTEAGEKEGKFFFRLLKPSPMVQSMIDKYKYETEWEENHMVGVHVRRGDLTIWGKNNDHKKVKSLIPIESYLTAMRSQKALAQGVRRVRFFLATDDAEAEAEIKAAFKPGYVLSYPKQNLSRNSVLGIQEALTDVMLLADCPVLIGTYYSSYSETAKMMGWPFYIQVGWDLKKLSIETKIEKDDPEEEDEVMKKLL